MRFIMGMPVIVEIVGEKKNKPFEKVFEYFGWVDEKFSPYKQNSEVTKLNFEDKDLKQILKQCAQTKKDTNGYFDVFYEGTFDPSGLVKGWAIWEASKILEEMKYKDFYIEAGGDIQTHGLNEAHEKWKVGVKNPFNRNQIIKIVQLSGEGIATSGNYEKGNHIYNPLGKSNSEIVSLTVIGKNVYEADRFATPLFAMGFEGIKFLEKKNHLEGYMIDKKGFATFTKGFEKYVN